MSKNRSDDPLDWDFDDFEPAEDEPSFFDNELPRLAEAVHEAYYMGGYRSIQCAGAVRKLCEAWSEMLG